MSAGRRRVLFASVGLSPQVVTETMHALRERAGWVPDELVILTTSKGAGLCRSLLLDPQHGALVGWARERGVPGIEAVAASARLEVVTSDSGDVDAERAALALAERAHQLLSELTARPETELHVSIAGGRKPAAALIAVLMAIHGRPQDRMSHVLLDPEHAAGSGFFYPTRQSRPLPAAAGQVVDAASVRITLVDIPFPRLGMGAVAAGDFRQLFDEVTRALGRPRLEVDSEAREIRWDGETVPVPPSIAAFLAWLADRMVRDGGAVPRVGASRDAFLAHYHAFAGPGAAKRAARRLPDPLDPEWMEEKAARANKLGTDCGMRPRGTRLVQRVGARAGAGYRLALDPNEIRFCGRSGEV